MLKAFYNLQLHRPHLQNLKQISLAKPFSSSRRSFAEEPQSPGKNGTEATASPGHKQGGHGRVKVLNSTAGSSTISDEGGVLRARHKNGSRYRKVKYDGTVRPELDTSQEKAVLASNAAIEAACATEDLGTVMSVYGSALPLISKRHTKDIAQLIHNSFRKAKQNDDDLSSLLEFMSKVIHDLKSGQLAPHPWAVIHLLSAFKELGRFEEGISLWNGVAGKDDRYVIPSTYGVLIELLSERGDPLDKLEELFQIGLRSHPDSFAEYHLAPNAILGDRAKRNATVHLPLALLQGIYTARMQHGDMRNGYLALDTALRLAPEPFPSRYLHYPILHRPAPEAYAAFILACRMGVNLGPGLLNILLSKMNAMFAPLFADYDSIRRKQKVARGMIEAFTAFITVGGRLSSRHLASLCVAIGSTIWEGENTDAQQVQDHSQATEAIGSMITSIIDLSSELNIPLDTRTLSSMVTTASKLGSSYVHAVLQYVSSHDLQPDLYLCRAMLLSAGVLKDADLLEQSWKQVVQLHRDAPHSTKRAWVCFARACQSAGFLRFGHDELSRSSKALPIDDHVREECREILNKPVDPNPHYLLREQTGKLARVNMDLCKLVESLVTRLRSGEPLAERLPETFLQDDRADHPINESQHESIYNDLTADPYSPDDSTVDVNTMGIPLDKLRYENWKSINALIYEATHNQLWSECAPTPTLSEAKDFVLKLRGMS
ncbi:hypothetical protein EV356DRAFT_570377 [Viridothelium virens]|uniref:Uncharacterized protein n=1 Tax=Viridothelium virens TaxID=1048519 RepID=A0A6A6GXQ6_VIRVR|nr:hypothetical protein EV356DRAFT_570377 [Viridothelium virens]